MLKKSLPSFACGLSDLINVLVLAPWGHNRGHIIPQSSKMSRTFPAQKGSGDGIVFLPVSMQLLEGPVEALDTATVQENEKCNVGTVPQEKVFRNKTVNRADYAVITLSSQSLPAIHKTVHRAWLLYFHFANSSTTEQLNRLPLISSHTSTSNT